MVTLDDAKLMGQESLEAERMAESGKIQDNPNEGGNAREKGSSANVGSGTGSKLDNLRYKFNQGTFSSSIGMDLK